MDPLAHSDTQQSTRGNQFAGEPVARINFKMTGLK
jgi:hypothetical protein